ncbi:hypothetical protein BH23BAC2_BH23BAC2_08830 [soil metagenome]
MKLNRILIIAVFSGMAFTSCKDNDRRVDDDTRLEMDRMETQRDTELRDQQRLDSENSVTARLQRNQNLSTFNEGVTRNQVSQNLNRTTTATGNTTGQTGTTTTGQTGTTTGQTGTTTNQSGTTGQMGGYTIFAPSNDAYSALTEAQRNEWNNTQNRDKNVAAINYLMVDQRVTREQLRQQIQNANGTYTIRTMQGENITATLDGSDIVLRDGAGNQAKVIESDNEGSNGVIHIIDKVLMPSDMTRNDAMSKTRTNTQ